MGGCPGTRAALRTACTNAWMVDMALTWHRHGNAMATTFHVHTPDHEFYLFADSKLEKESWVGDIERLLSPAGVMCNDEVQG